MNKDFDSWNEELYAIYPRKIGKRAAIRAIANARVRIHDGEMGKPMVWEDAQRFLLDKTRQYAASPAGNRDTYTPHPSTFFNQSRYMDHEIEWHRLTDTEQLRGLASIGRGEMSTTSNKELVDLVKQGKAWGSNAKESLG